MPSRNKTVPIVAAVVAATTAVVGAVVLLKGRRGGSKEVDDDEAFSAVKPSPPKKVESKEKRPATMVAEAKPVVLESPTPSGEGDVAKAVANPIANDDAILDAVLDEVVPKSPPVKDPASSVSVKPSAPSSSLDGNRTNLEHLGVSIKVPSDWEVHEELSPVPNVAMVSVWNPAFANVPNADVPGAVPVLVLSVEDIRGENLNLFEFKECSKELSIQRMLMMTGGNALPTVRRDSAVQEGPFRHYLEYAQSIPPFFSISVINLVEVRNGIAYVFQIMAGPKAMNDYKSLFMQIARDIVITPMETSALGFLNVKTGKISIQVDTTWVWSYPDAEEASKGADNAPLATFELASTVKREKLTLYETSKVPKSDHKPRSDKETDGVKINSSFNGTQERKTFSYNGYTLVVEPEQKAISFIPEAVVVLAIKSVRACSDEPRPKEGVTFVTSEYGYQFDMVGGSRVVSTKLGKGTVVYAPLGIPQDPTKELAPEEQGPTVTVRIGNPDDDPDCLPTIEEWKTRIERESASASISGIKMISLKGEQCLTFRSKEMQKTGMEESTEILGEIYIFVRHGITTLIRWEAARSQFRKYERDLNTFLESFQFLA